MNRRLETPAAAFDARRDGLALVVLALAAVAIQLPIYDRWINFLDEGAIVQIADQINHGGLPYRDGVHVAFPGVFYLTAGLFELFGTSVAVVRCFMLVLFTVFIGVFYLLVRCVASRGVAFGAALLAVSYRVWAFPHWQMINYSSLVMVPLMVGVAILALDVERPRRFLPPLAGAAIGVGIVCKQDLASVTLLVLAVFVLSASRNGRSSWRATFGRAAAFGAAGVFVPAAVVLAFVPAGLAGEMLHQTIWYPLVAQPYWTPTSFGGFYAGFPPFWPPWAQAEVIRDAGFFSYFPGIVLDLHLRELLKSWAFRETVLPELFVRAAYGLPIALLAVSIVREVAGSVRRRRTSDSSREAWVQSRRMWLLIAFGLAAMLSFNRPRDWIHLMILYVPTLLLLGPLVEWLAGSAAGLRRRGVLVASAAGVGVALVVSLALVVEAHRRHATPLSMPRAGLFVDAESAAVIEPLVSSLMPEPGESPAPLAALPAQPLLNFLTGRPLATRFLTLLPNREFEDRDEQVVRDLNRDPRTEVVYAIQHSPFSPLPQEYMPGVFADLVARHQLGEGPTGLFSETPPVGLLFARLTPRPERDEDVLYDFSEHIDDAIVTNPGAEGDALGEAVSGLETWPFEHPVLTIAPPVAPGTRSLTYRVEPSADARLRFGVAMNPDRWSSFFARSLRFVVRVDDEVVFDATLDPYRKPEDRRWEWGDVPVSPGMHHIEFTTSADNAYGARLGLAGFARPRLVASRRAAPR